MYTLYRVPVNRIILYPERGRESPAAMSLCRKEPPPNRSETPLPPDSTRASSTQFTSLRHTVHKPLPYRTTFLKPCFMCFIKDLKDILTQWQNSVTKSYNYLLIVMNCAFDYSLRGLLVLRKLKHFSRGKQDI